MSHSEQMNELVAALSKAQGAMKPAKFDSENPHFQSKYASYVSVVEACKPLFAQGLSFTHQVAVSQDGNFWVCVTTLWHTSGQWISSSYPLSPFTTQHKFASDYTYAKRYTLCGLVGLAADEDDDANEAQKVTPPHAIGAQPPKTLAQSLDLGEPKEIPIGEDMDQEGWVRIGQQLIAAAARPDWVEWEKMNGLGMARMANEAPKVYARMIAAIARG